MMRRRLSTGVYDTVPEELRKVPPLVLDVAVRIVIPILAVVLVVLLAFGCAHKPTIGDATKGAQLALGFVREASAQLEPLHELGTDMAIAHCRATVPESASSAEREACLAGVGFSPAQIEQHRIALEQLADAYDSIADALAAVDAAWPVLQQMSERAKALRDRAQAVGP